MTESPSNPKNHDRKPHRHLLELLVCPVTLGPLRYDAEAKELVSERASLAFPIRDGMPILVEDEARILED